MPDFKAPGNVLLGRKETAYEGRRLTAGLPVDDVSIAKSPTKRCSLLNAKYIYGWRFRVTR